MLRIILIDDHGVLRDGLAAVLAGQRDFEVVASLGTARAGITACAELKPDVVVLDYSLPDLDGIEAARQLLLRCPGSRLLVLTMCENADVAKRMLAVGASGYVLKTSDAEELIAAIRKVAQGRRYVTPQLVDAMLDGLGWLSDEPPESQLTERELQVLRSIGEGLTVAEIAHMLSLSTSTVETYRARLKAKLDLHSTADIIRFAIRRGLISP